jgi:ribonuclease E
LPFDEEVRRTIEARHPGVVFDWDTLASTPIPPPEPVEHWREKRRAEKAIRQARRTEEQEQTAVETTVAVSPVVDIAEGDVGFSSEAPGECAASDHERSDGGAEASYQSEQAQDAEESAETAVTAEGAAAVAGQGQRRRRRGGRRRRRGRPSQAPTESGEALAADAASESVTSNTSESPISGD